MIIAVNDSRFVNGHKKRGLKSRLDFVEYIVIPILMCKDSNGRSRFEHSKIDVRRWPTKL